MAHPERHQRWDCSPRALPAPPRADPILGIRAVWPPLQLGTACSTRPFNQTNPSGSEPAPLLLPRRDHPFSQRCGDVPKRSRSRHAFLPRVPLLLLLPFDTCLFAGLSELGARPLWKILLDLQINASFALGCWVQGNDTKETEGVSKEPELNLSNTPEDGCVVPASGKHFRQARYCCCPTGLTSAGWLGTSPAPVVALGSVKPLCCWGFGGWGIRKGKHRLRGQPQKLGEKHWNRGDDWE